MKRIIRESLILLFILVTLPVFAAGPVGKTVRIGYFPEPGMMDGAEPGARKSGYGYEYIQELASCAGWKYEYEYGSFGELYQKLLAGKIDMLPYTTKNEERLTQVLFPNQEMGDENLYLASMKAGRLSESLSELEGTKVGTIKGAFYNASVMELFEEKGINCTFVEYATPELRWAALEKGIIDYSIESSTVCQNIDLHVVYEFGPGTLFYLVVSPGRTDLLEELNKAQRNIAYVNPGFLENLKLKYFMGIALFKELPDDCQEWLENHSSIRIGTYDKDEPYVIENGDGTFSGIACDYVDCMLNAMGIDVPVEWKLYPGKEQALEALNAGDIDCINPYYHNYADAEKDSVIISQTLYDSNFSVLYLGQYTSETLSVIATPSTRLGASYVRDNYPDAVIIPCQNGYDCLEKLDAGEANCVIMYTDALENIAAEYTRKHTIKDLTIDCAVCFAALPEDAPLIGIFNKAIPFVSSVQRSAIQDKYSIEKKTAGLVLFFKTHPECLYGTIILICIGIMIMMYLRIKREKRFAEKQKENAIYKNIIDRFTSTFEAVFLGNLNDGSYTVLENKTDTINLFTGSESLAASARRFLESIVHPYDKKRIAGSMIPFNDVRTMLPVGESDILEFRANTPDGYHWYRSTLNRISDDEILLGFKDCDKEIRAKIVEDKLMSEYDAIYIVDLIREEIYPSRSSRVSSVGAITGKTPYTEMVLKFADTVAPAYRDDWVNFSDIEFMKQYLAHEDHREYVYELPETIHSMRRFSADVVERMDGKAAIALFSFMAIDDLRAQAIIMHRQMAEQKVLLDYFVDSYDTAYIVNIADSTFETLHMNHNFARLFGKYGQNRESMNAFIAEHVHPADQGMMLQYCDPAYVRKRLEDEPSFTFLVREEFDDVEKMMRGVIIRGADSDHVAVGFMDVTEELRKEQEAKQKLEDALSMAQSANRAKTTFLNNMSHDIRTPMNAIIGYTGLATRHIDDIDLVKDYLSKINQSGDHLLSLINDVLDMSRIESGNMHIDEKEENIHEIINGLRAIVSEDMRLRGHELAVEMVHIKDEEIICDKLRLNQVLLNVLSNANKYTEAGGGISLVVIERPLRKRGSACFEFCVSDTGMGMSPEFLETVFDPFTRAESSTVSGIQGTGLGMAITKNLVDMMGGTIDVKSEEGKGTEVNMTFEFKLKKKTAGQAENPETEPAADESLLEGKKVLLVEDNQFNREIATEILEEYGIIVDHAEDGSVAVRKMKAAEKGDYDLVLMDIQMPVMDGYEATRQIRALGTEISKIPIIAMTANAFEEDRQMALDAGMNEHIPKPIDFDRLEQIMESFIG